MKYPQRTPKQKIQYFKYKLQQLDLKYQFETSQIVERIRELEREVSTGTPTEQVPPKGARV
jgi:hypothetical protein